MWDDTQELYEPLRAVLRDVAGLFPAAMQPYLQARVLMVRGPCRGAYMPV